jgi:hypothetical protein
MIYQLFDHVCLDAQRQRPVNLRKTCIPVSETGLAKRGSSADEPVYSRLLVHTAAALLPEPLNEFLNQLCVSRVRLDFQKQL